MDFMTGSMKNIVLLNDTKLELERENMIMGNPNFIKTMKS